MKNKKRKKKINKKLFQVLGIIVCVLVSVGLITYPYISNYVYEHQASSIIETVEKTEENADSDAYKEELEKATSYNEYLNTANVKLTDPFIEDESNHSNGDDYYNLLNMTNDGVMGYIKIPCIDVSLPIYHGTDDATLEKGVGHLEGSSLPIGGVGTHSILTGHTGLSRAKLFTDLTELDEGDMFYIYTAGLKLAYQIDNINVIEPEDISKLTIEDGKDYCTLLTCTPYGINSHRLIVRGVRTEYVEEEEKAEESAEKKTDGSQWMREYTKAIIIASWTFISLMFVLIIYRELSAEKRRKQAWMRKKKKQKKT